MFVSEEIVINSTSIFQKFSYCYKDLLLHLERIKDSLNVQSCNSGSWSAILLFWMCKSNLSIVKVLVQTDLLPLFLLHLCAKYVSVKSCKFTAINITEYMTSVIKVESSAVFCSRVSFMFALQSLFLWLFTLFYNDILFVMPVCNFLR